MSNRLEKDRAFKRRALKGIKDQRIWPEFWTEYRFNQFSPEMRKYIEIHGVEIMTQELTVAPQDTEPDLFHA